MKTRLLILSGLLIAAVCGGQQLTEPGWFELSGGTNQPSPDLTPEASEPPEWEGLGGYGPSGDSVIAEAITPEIQALARGLENDPVRIYNYVHDHIRPALYFGSKKGAHLTLLEKSGNDFDQSALLVALLRAAGQDNVYYQFGWMGIPYENPDGSHRDLRHWLGLNFANTNWAATSNYLTTLFTMQRGYPMKYVLPGDTNLFLFQRVWVRLKTGLTNYFLDPGFKVSEPITSLINLTNAMSFSSNGVMSAAAGLSTGNYVTNLNEAALRSTLSDYTSNLLATLQAQCPTATVDEVLGGWRIVPSTNQCLFTNVTFQTYVWNYPGIAEMPIVNWETQPTNLMSKLKISFAGTNYQWFMPQLRGQRLALTFATNGLAELWQEDTLLAQRPTGGNNSRTNVVLAVDHPFGHWNWTNNTLIDHGFADHTVTNSYQRTNASYALFYGFAPTWDWLRERQSKLADYRQQGWTDVSRPVLTETLNVMGLQWALQERLAGKTLSQQMSGLYEHHHRLGRMAQESSRGYYVDSYMAVTCFFSRDGSGADQDERRLRNFDLWGYFASALEYGVIEQLQPTNLTAASTIKMLQIANTNGQAIYLASSTNWQTAFNVRSKLTAYPNLAVLDNLIARGYTLLLPRHGSNHVAGPASWAGHAYISRFSQDVTNDTRFTIEGGYQGGHASDPNATADPAYIQYAGASQPYVFEPPSFTPAADPVNMANGAFTLNATDLALGQSEPRGLTLTRNYTPARRYHDLAGMAHGWTHNYAVSIGEVAAPEAGLGGTTPHQMAAMLVATRAAIEIYRTNGFPKNWMVTALIAKWGVDQLTKKGVSILLGKDTIQFVEQPDGSFTPPAGSTMTLRKTNSVFWLQERHGNTFKFDALGRLTNIVDQYNQPLTVTYNASNWVESVTDWKGRYFTFTYTGSPQRLSSVSDSTGRSASYGYATTYSPNGDLVSVTDPEQKPHTFTYDTNHQITATLNAAGQTVTSNLYDGFGRVIEQYSEGDTNKTWRLYWSGYQNVEQDPTGSKRGFFYDDKSRLIAVQDALSNVSRTFYDGQDHVVMTVSPLNETNRFEFDGNHNLTQSLDPLGFTNQFFYDGQNNLYRSVDQRGNPSTFGYNPKFQLTGSTNGAGDWVSFDYNSDGTLHTRTDPGGTISYDYDATYRQLNRITYPNSLGGESFVTSALGDVTTHTDARGFATMFSYNNRRELTNTVAPTNITSRVAYDAVGNVAATTDPRGFTSSNTWSATRKLLATTLPATPQGVPLTTNIYDNRDWLARTINPLQQATAFTNDAAQRLIGVTDPLLRTTKFGYDNDNRKTSTTNAANEVTRQTWNLRSELTQTTTPASTTIQRSYDAAGNQVLLTNRNGKIWQFQFDAANRLTNTITPLSRETRIAYDSRGLVSTVREPSGQTLTNYYDAKGRLTNTVDAAISTLFRYDANNNVTNIVENGKTNAWTLDAYDRVQSYQDADGNLIQYRHDANGNLTNLIYPGNRVVAYAYDSLNRLTNVTDWANRKTTFIYDLGSRLASIIRPNGTTRTIGYDVAGQATNIVEKMAIGVPIAFFKLNWNDAARVQWEFAAPLPHAYTPPSRAMTFDDDNRLATFNGNGVANDADGNLTGGPLTNYAFAAYAYNPRNRLRATFFSATVKCTYGYDPAGHRTSLTDLASGEVTRFVVNPNASLSQVLIRTRSGVTNFYIYGLGLQYEITETATTTNTLTYHYDYRGSTIALTDANGNVTDRVEYSPYATTTYRSGTNDTPFLYNGRYGVQTDPNTLLYMRARFYNPYLCRFLNADPSGFSGGLNFYAYADGNPISLIDPYGLWAGVDDLLFAGIGALVGAGAQGFADLVKGKPSGWGAYGSAAAAGAAGGEATLYTGPVGGGLAAGFTQNLFKQGDKILSGQQANYNFLDAGKDTAIGGAVGAIPVPGIAGITAGRGSFQAVERQILTKLENGTIQSFGVTTGGKIAITEIYTSLPSVGFEGIQAAFGTFLPNGQSWLTTPNTFQFGSGFNNLNSGIK